MAISGQIAVKVLAAHSAEVELFQKDNTDKFWSYKLTKSPRCEFAFDPRTTTKLIIRFDTEPPKILGISFVEDISGKNISTALNRVFSGGMHVAKFKAIVENEAALVEMLKKLGT